MEKVILIGYFNETVELCEKCGCSIVGYIDNAPKGLYTYLGNDDTFIENYLEYVDIPLVITPDNPNVRGKLYEKYRKLGFKFKTLIAPDAVISKLATISEGCMVQSLCNVSSNVFLGECVRLNVGANVMHDTYIDKFSIVAPNAVVLGNVNVGSKTYIGANSTILPNLSIGNYAMVGAGSVVTKNVQNGIVVAGVPARIMNKNV